MGGSVEKGPEVMKPIEIVAPGIKLARIRAITLFPMILYVSTEVKANPCIRAHELYHFNQALRWGVLPFYAVYLVLAIFNIGKPASRHPMERTPYRIQRDCEEKRSTI